MIITRKFTDRMTIAALMLTATLPFAAVTPVKAATVSCAAQLQAVQDSAATADPKAATKALRTARVAEKICTEGNGFEAAKKFARARTQLGTDVQLASQR